MKMIDEASFRAGMEEMRTKLAPSAAEPGQIGVSARCMIAASEGMHRFITREIENETDPNQISRAIVVFMANIVGGFASNLEFGPNDSQKRFAADFIRDCGAALFSLIEIADEDIEHTDVKYVEGGRA